MGFAHSRLQFNLIYLWSRNVLVAAEYFSAVDLVVVRRFFGAVDFLRVITRRPDLVRLVRAVFFAVREIFMRVCGFNFLCSRVRAPFFAARDRLILTLYVRPVFLERAKPRLRKADGIYLFLSQ